MVVGGVESPAGRVRVRDAQGLTDAERFRRLRRMHDSGSALWRARAGRVALGLGANVIGAAFGAVRNKLFAHFLGTAGVGAYAQLVTAATYAGTVAAMGLALPVAQAVGAATARGDAAAIRRTMSTALIAIGVAVTFLAALGIVFAAPFARLLLGEHGDPALVRLALLFAGGLAFQGTIQGLFSGRSDLRALLTYAILGNLGATLAVAALVPAFGVRGAVVGASCFYPAAILGTLLVHRGRYRETFQPAPEPRFDRGEAGTLLKVALTTLVMAMLDLGTLLGLRTHFAHAEGLAANGLFQSALSLSQQGGAVFYAYLGSYAFGKISGAAGPEGIRAYTRRQAAPFVALAALAFAAAAVLARPLIHVLYTREFDAAVPMLRWTLYGEFAKVAMQAWMFGALPLGGVRLFFPLGVSYPLSMIAGYATARALGLGPMSLAAAYAFAGTFSLALSGAVMSARGVPFTANGLLVLLAGLAGLAALALLGPR